MSILTAMQRVDREIEIPSFGKHWIHPETYDIYAECGFDFNKMTSLPYEYMKERHKAFYKRLRKKLIPLNLLIKQLMTQIIPRDLPIFFY